MLRGLRYSANPVRLGDAMWTRCAAGREQAADWAASNMLVLNAKHGEAAQHELATA